MTSVHPIIDDTVVQINDENGLQSTDQEEEQINEQRTSNRDQTNDKIIDKKQTNSTIQSINSKSDELNERIETNQNNSNQVENEKSDNVKDILEQDAIDKLQMNIDQRTNRSDSISSKSSYSLTSSLSSASSSRSDQDKKEQKEPKLSLLDKDQTIFKPIINGLTNSTLFRPKQPDKEQDAKFLFTWSNLSYFVYITSRFGLGKKKKKFIFNQINGELKSNQLFGLLGPSGNHFLWTHF